MAEVYLGTHQAMGGFRKLVVMKRLLGWRSADDEAIEGLLDEARIAATINHPNVVTTLDIGLDRNAPYIVLEYLSGEDLLYILHDLHARKASIPLGVACRIGASIAAALAQAHDLVLPDGTRRCIVHRDVTPSNIIVCYSGITKLLDFGVARVVDDVPKTKAGLIKGKFSYLAPEQLTGAPLDGRTDVFQLGIVLWEMVTMSRLFEGKSDHERVNAVLNRPIQTPSKLNPSVPPCLDRTILRALDRDPDKRHQTAHDLENELLEALASLGVSGGDHSVGKWMQAAFEERYRWRLELERRTVTEAEQAPADDDDDEVDIEIDGGAPRSGSSLRGIAVEATPATQPRSVARYIVPLLLLGAVAAAALVWTYERGLFASDEPDAEPSPASATAPASAVPADYDVDLRVSPAHATIAIDGVVVAKGRYRASFPDDGAVHTVTFSAPDHGTVQRRVHGATTLEVSLESTVATRTAPTGATADAEDHADDDDDDRRRTEARRRRRDRKHADETKTAAPPPATAIAPTTKPGGAPPTGAGSASAPPPPPPKPPADFAPSTDNLDPFK